MQAPFPSDIEIWLNSKLEGPWSSERLSSLLTAPILEAVKARFTFLETSIKLKLLFSFATLNKRMREELDEHVKDILQIASEDDDEWVQIICKLFSVLMLSEGSLSDNNGMLENQHLQELLSQLRESCTFLSTFFFAFALSLHLMTWILF